ncbi:pimeloyl-ACP methyl ester carboxylesterase [Streptomyces canus]|uniref:alpha/beta fold hydrolase n=1 Tax=Streptomyces canus TaxID=58343 RepID=UPI00277D9D8A|nr:hypothetical protein [Streptomyces canus]MDQ0597010.1 pimeloyl-ACP methyl ester carboxylesterase [Streptomyces canus]
MISATFEVDGRPGVPMDLARQASGARALIDGLAGGQALVFGSSGGAIIGLTLAALHPDSLRAAGSRRNAAGTGHLGVYGRPVTRAQYALTGI